MVRPVRAASRDVFSLGAAVSTTPAKKSNIPPSDPKPAPQAAAESAAEAEEDGADDGPRLGRNLVWGLAAGGSSMVVHLAGLLVLGLMMVPGIDKPPTKVIEATIREERPVEDLVQKLDKPIVPSQSLTPNSSAVSSSAPAAGISGATSSVVAAPKLNTTTVNRPTAVRVDVGIVNVFTKSGNGLTMDVPQGTGGEALAATTGYADAMDRMTQEILNKLARGKVLVVWALDQSESMNDDREEIQARIERVYVELGLADAKLGNNDALLTAVISYGSSIAQHTAQPTSKVDEIIAAMKAVPNDPAGKEMMCQALSYSVSQFQKLVTSGGRQMMVIMVTDESGDAATNFSMLEQTIATAKAARTPIYFLGREAVFGYPYAHMHWIDPTTKVDFWLRIDRGPETPYPEQLQVDGIHRRFDAHPSGFGPYEQSRIARQTGGVFFMLPTPEADLWRRDDRTYDPESMRPYLPDLSARADYAAERDKHPLRAALWKVIADLNPYDARGEVKTDSPVQVQFWDFPIEPAAFAQRVEINTRKAQTLIQYFAKAQQALEVVAKDRNRDPSRRWRANYDVTYAQTIAYQARLYEYIAYLNGFVKSPKPIKNELGPNRPTNAWDGYYVTRTMVDDPKVAALREKSATLYKQVMEEHPGTPWAARAEYELKRGFGVDLREDYEDPRRPNIKPPIL